MRSEDILGHVLLVESYMTQAAMLVESVCKNLNDDQRTVVENICREFQPLVEVTLTPEKIEQLFANVEAEATASGLNRTGLGKIADVASAGYEKSREVKMAVDAITDKAEQWFRNTTPVRTFDQQYAALEAAISKKFPTLSTKIDQLGQFARSNPKTTAAIIGVLTSIASLAAGPVGNAIANQVVTRFLKTKTTESTTLSYDQVMTIIEWCDGSPSEIIMEGPVDAIKGAVSKGVSALKQIGKNLSNKITADKLTKAWKSAGSPTDSNIVAELLRQAGVSDQVLKPVFKSMKIKLPVPKTPSVTTAVPVKRSSTRSATPVQGTTVAPRELSTRARRVVRVAPGTSTYISTAPSIDTDTVVAQDEVGSRVNQLVDYQTLKTLVQTMKKRDAVRLLAYIDKIDPPVDKPLKTQSVANTEPGVTQQPTQSSTAGEPVPDNTVPANQTSKPARKRKPKTPPVAV